MKKMPKQKSDFAKGGVRYKKLKAKVVELMPPDETPRWLFIGTKASTRSVNSSRATLLLSKEMAFVATDKAVHVIPMPGVGVFSSKVDASQMVSRPLSEVDVSVDAGNRQISVDDVSMTIYLDHDYDALQFAAACGAQMPDWFVSA